MTSDYDAISVMLEFNPDGNEIRTANLSTMVNPDQAIEHIESFSLVLSTFEPAIHILQNTTEVKILDTTSTVL